LSSGGPAPTSKISAPLLLESGKAPPADFVAAVRASSRGGDLYRRITNVSLHAMRFEGSSVCVNFLAAGSCPAASCTHAHVRLGSGDVVVKSPVTQRH
jgi:hypothetical protein